MAVNPTHSVVFDTPALLELANAGLLSPLIDELGSRFRVVAPVVEEIKSLPAIQRNLLQPVLDSARPIVLNTASTKRAEGYISGAGIRAREFAVGSAATSAYVAENSSHGVIGLGRLRDHLQRNRSNLRGPKDITQLVATNRLSDLSVPKAVPIQRFGRGRKNFRSSSKSQQPRGL